MKELTSFDGREVVGATIALVSAGDGLSKAMQVAPAEYHHGEKVYLVIESECAKVRFDKSKDDPSKLLRVHTLKAGIATVVDQKLVAKVISEQRKANDLLEGRETIDGFVEPDHSRVSEPVPIGRAAEKEAERVRKMAERAAKAAREKAEDS